MILQFEIIELLLQEFFNSIQTKKMKNLTFIKIRLLTLILLFPVFCQAQHRMAKANRFYDNLAFAEAVPEYKKVLKSDSTNSEAIFRIANCYRMINNTTEAEKWYSKAIQLDGAKPTHLIYYTEALMSNGEYKEAEKWIMKFRQVAGEDSRTNRIVESLNNINSLIEDSLNYSIQKLSINSNNADCCPVFYNNGIVFSSTRSRNELIKQVHQWTDRPFFTLYYSKGKDNNFSTPKIFAPSITTDFNNATICFNKTGDELYITRNNIDDGKVRRSDSGIVKLKIYHYKKSGSKWIDESSFQYNSDQYNCAHPSLNPDGSKLFFASDMPGGFGGLDLYVCKKEGNLWGKPENLGPAINTSRNDCFPYIDDNEGLFFASNGRGGLGGFDIYYSSKSNNTYAEPVNLGYPINSANDDFGWVQNETGTSGYFSSNRESKDQNDDIYSFKRVSVLLNVLVYDSKTKLPLTASTVKVIESGIQKRVLTTSDNGTINLLMKPGKDYKFIAEKEKYVPDTSGIEAKSLDTASIRNLSIALKKELTNIMLTGRISSNDVDKNGIENTIVSLTDKETGKGITTTTSKEGLYKFEHLTLDSRYSLEAKKNDGVSYPVDISIDDLENNKTLNTDLVLHGVQDVVKIDNIYYDLDKFNVRPDAAIELNRIVAMMKSNPAMKIELRSHTDCRQSDEYNMKLSERRAKSAVAYLIKNGISSSRLVANGYGKTMLINHCECEGTKLTPCTEEEHQQNRRTEFKILSLN